MENFIKYIILPSNLVILFLLTGLALFFINKWKKVALTFMISAAGMYIIFGFGPISFWLLGSLEYRYPPLNDYASIRAVDNILVLTGHAEIDPRVSLSSQVNSTSAFRIIEAARIFNIYPQSTIIISGIGSVPEITKDLLVAINIPGEKIVLENKSNNTYESARNIQTILGSKRFILVTSAGHMPRAIKVFQKQGMDPIPGPTDYLTRKNYLAIRYLPLPSHLNYSDLAIYEYVGMAWYWFMDRI